MLTPEWVREVESLRRSSAVVVSEYYESADDDAPFRSVSDAADRACREYGVDYDGFGTDDA